MHQVAHLLDPNGTRFGLGTNPMDVRVIAVFDFAAVQAGIAAVDSNAGAAPGRLEAVERASESFGDGLEFPGFRASEQVGMGQAAALERALQQFQSLALVWKVFERHAGNKAEIGKAESRKRDVRIVFRVFCRYVKRVKTITTREFFHSPLTVKALHPGQSLAVTDNGKPSFVVTKAGKRPRRTLQELEEDSVKVAGKRLELVKGILDLRRG